MGGTMMDAKQVECNGEGDEKEPMIRFTVDLPESLHTDFTVFAAKCRKTKAALVRQAIAQMMEEEPVKQKNA